MLLKVITVIQTFRYMEQNWYKRSNMIRHNQDDFQFHGFIANENVAKSFREGATFFDSHTVCRPMYYFGSDVCAVESKVALNVYLNESFSWRSAF